MGKVPVVPLAGVPLSTLVDVLKVTPEGRAPDSDKVERGKPVMVMVKEPAEPTVNVVLLALVMAAVWFTVRVKVWEASAPTPL